MNVPVQFFTHSPSPATTTTTTKANTFLSLSQQTLRKTAITLTHTQTHTHKHGNMHAAIGRNAKHHHHRRLNWLYWGEWDRSKEKCAMKHSRCVCVNGCVCVCLFVYVVDLYGKCVYILHDMAWQWVQWMVEFSSSLGFLLLLLFLCWMWLKGDFEKISENGNLLWLLYATCVRMNDFLKFVTKAKTFFCLFKSLLLKREVSCQSAVSLDYWFSWWLLPHCFEFVARSR